MTDDPELLRRYVEEKSQAAFAELVGRHLSFVYQTALRQVGGDTHAAEDVAQSVFTDLARKAASLSGRAVLGGWLHTSTRFAALRHRRTEQRRRVRETELHLMNELTRSTEPPADWERLRPVIDEALHALGAKDRDAIVLRFFEGCGFAEMGSALQLSEEGARLRVTRALERLHPLLARRGIISTTAALSLALTAQSALGAPAGLASNVTASALGAAAEGGVGGLASGLGIFGIMKISSLILAASLAANAGIVLKLLDETAAGAMLSPVSRFAAILSRPTQTDAVPGVGPLTDPEVIGRKLRSEGYSDVVVATGVNSAVAMQGRIAKREEIATKEARVRRWNPQPRDSVAVAPFAGLKVVTSAPYEDPLVAKQREQALASLGLDTSGKPLDSLYRGVPADKARLIRRIEDDYMELRQSDAVMGLGAMNLLNAEFERDVLAVLTPGEQTNWLRYSSNAAKELQKALAGVDVSEASYAIMADASVATERTAQVAGRYSAELQAGLYLVYRREVGDERFLRVARNLSTGREQIAVLDAIYEQAGLSIASRNDRFFTAFAILAENRPPDGLRLPEVMQLRASLAAGLNADQTAAFDASPIGAKLKGWIQPTAAPAAGK